MDLGQLLSVVGVMMTAAMVAVGVARKLNLGAIVALLLVGIALGPHSPVALVTASCVAIAAIVCLELVERVTFGPVANTPAPVPSG